MRVINFSDARNQLKSVLDQVVDDSDYTVITRRDANDAVVMSLDQFNGLMETVHLLKSPANAAHLSKFEQVADPVSALLVAAQESGNPAVPADRTIANVGDLIKQNRNPEWKARTSLNWKLNNWRAGISAKYTSEVVDTSTTATVDGEVIKLPVDSYTTVNLYGSYNFDEGNMLEGMKVTLGVRNVGDKEPPLADDFWHGYAGDYHSNRGRYVYLNLSKSF